MSGNRIREIILHQSRRANVGHIGSGLCVADILAVLYGGVLRADGPRDPQRDRFILSKGHAALALYAALHLRGWMAAEELDTYCTDGTLLGVHPERELPGVDFSTGSLGHGLSYAIGAAMAARRLGKSYRIFALLSDAECNEGSTWEAVMLGAQHELSNVVAIVDVNGQQALGYTSDVVNLSPLAEKWRAFGWQVREVDGHNEAALHEALEADGGVQCPRVVLAQTVFGKGVPFMEGQIKWHYLPMSDDEYIVALRAIGAV